MDARAPVVDEAGTPIGALIIAELPSGARLQASGAVPVVVEGGTYRFAVELDVRPEAVRLEPGAELFNFDTSSHRTGRLEPKQHVGRVRVGISVPGSSVAGTAEFEVAPTKLEYATEYQHMLGD